MARDVAHVVRETVTQAVRDAAHNLGARDRGKAGGALSGGRGVAAGAGLVAVAPLVTKAARKAVRRRLAARAAKKPGKLVDDATSKLGDSVGEHVEQAVKEKVDEAGGAGGLAKQAAVGVLPGLRGAGDDSRGVEGVAKGRRMPVQQAVDVAVPIETAYNQWTQFEDWPRFMHRVTQVTQEDDCTVSFATKIWTRTREFEAQILTQRPDERIKWRVARGITHTGVVTFHELAPRLTRIEVTMDVDPGSLIEKAARGMRHVKRAVRADLHRFKAYIEMQERETGAWRGVIEEGELVRGHDPGYDAGREHGASSGEAGADQEARDEDEPEVAEEDAKPEPERGRRSAPRARPSSGRASGARSRKPAGRA